MPLVIVVAKQLMRFSHEPCHCQDLYRFLFHFFFASVFRGKENQLLLQRPMYAISNIRTYSAYVEGNGTC